MVCITLGNNTDICINKEGRLIVQSHDGYGRPTAEIDLGLATELRIEAIQDYLGRLYCHAVPEPKKVV